jgi:hypothetical protein
MLIRNDTPFAAIGFSQLHRDGMEMAVTAVRARHNLAPEGQLHLADRQEIALSDVYEGDPQQTPLVQVGDLIAYKPATDVTLLGTAFVPSGGAARSWGVSIAIGAHEASLRVHGPRQWEPTLKLLKPTWKLGAAEPVASVHLDYRLASGGRVAGDPEAASDQRNPLGPGLIHEDWTPIGKALRAPQVDSTSAPIVSPLDRPEPQGFGPVPPHWLWRERYCGTRDERWRRERCPQAPADFDYRFFQTAHPDLILPHLVGDERVRLEGLVPGGAPLAFELPAIALVVHHEWRDGRRVTARLRLDGLHLDLRAPDGLWTVDLTWRGWVVRCPAYRGASLATVDLGAAAELPSSGEHGLELADAAA